MYSMLIVDNEHLIVDSVLNYFEQWDVELELYPAYSSRKALMIMERAKIDILLTDIRMPDMDGLALQREVIARWPWCRTIFLTGYDDFEYIQQALRNGSIDYLLKTEGWDAIGNSVRKAIAQIEEAALSDRILEDARRDMMEAQPMIRDKLMLALTQGAAKAGEATARFASLGIPLDPVRRVFPVLLCVDNATGSASDLLDLTYAALQNMASEWLRPYARVMQVVLAQGKAVWLMTPLSTEPDAYARLRATIQGVIEHVQRQLEQAMGVELSACLALDGAEWEDLSDLLRRLSHLLNMSARYGQSIIVLEREDDSLRDNNLYADVREYNAQMRNMEIYLDSGNRLMFYELFRKIAEISEQVPEQNRNDVRMEVLSALLGILLGYMNRWSLRPFVESRMDMSEVRSFLCIYDWREAIDCMSRLSDAIFAAKAEWTGAQEDDFLARIHWTVKQNLGGDLTLTRLGEVMGMNPYYLSRVYLSATGKSLKAHISECRFEKAKELLLQNMLVRDIAQAVGFLSEQAFHRFFKGMCGMTPQEYRKLCNSAN